MEYPHNHKIHLVRDAESSRVDARDRAASRSATVTTVISVPLCVLKPADSPRLEGEDKAHIARLAETETPLPPILVNRRTMRVIDGMHRLMAATLQGRETIDVIFADEDESDVFLRAVQENIAHGLPLSQADRRAAVARIIASHPHMSDRAIGHSAGVGAKTVAAIRRNLTEEVPQSNARVGRDGKVRPLDSGIGRRRAAELLTDQPGASLRVIARAAGISPATVLDVRKRLERGESPLPKKLAAKAALHGAEGNGMAVGTTVVPARAPQPEPAAPARRSPRTPSAPDLAVTVEKLLRDPSLRNNERGRGILRLLHVNAAGVQHLPDTTAVVPSHCAGAVVQLAGHYAKMWEDFASKLDERARIIGTSAVTR